MAWFQDHVVYRFALRYWRRYTGYVHSFTFAVALLMLQVGIRPVPTVPTCPSPPSSVSAVAVDVTSGLSALSTLSFSSVLVPCESLSRYCISCR